MKSIALVLLLLCFQLHLLLASPAHEPWPLHKSTSSPGDDLEIPNVITVNRKGGGHGGSGHGGRGGGGRARIIPFYGGGGGRGSHRSMGHHHSGSNRFFTNTIVNIATLLFTTVLLGIRLSSLVYLD